MTFSRLKDCPQIFTVAFEAPLLDQLFIFWTIFQPWALSSDIPAAERGLFIRYPPNNFSRRTHVDRPCIFCGFFRVSRYGIVKQLFIYPSLASAKIPFLVLLDQLKV